MAHHSPPAPLTEALEGMRVNDTQFLQPDLPDAAVGFMMRAPPRFCFPFQAAFRFFHEGTFKAQEEMSLKDRMFDQIRLQVESLQSALLSYREVCNMPNRSEELEIRLATALSERDDHARARVAACAETRAADDRARELKAHLADRDSTIADLVTSMDNIRAELSEENQRIRAELSEAKRAMEAAAEENAQAKEASARAEDESARAKEASARAEEELARAKEELLWVGSSEYKEEIINEYYNSEAAGKREEQLMESAAEQIFDAIRANRPDWDISFLTEESPDDADAPGPED